MSASMWLQLVALLVLTLLSALFGVQHLIVLPRLRRDLIKFNAKRARRVQSALAAPSAAAWNEPAMAPNHSFAGWVTLNENGTLTVGGEILNPSEAFQVTARDAHHVPRAVVVASGQGDVIIRSHGQVFLARYAHGSWLVQPTAIPA